MNLLSCLSKPAALPPIILCLDDWELPSRTPASHPWLPHQVCLLTVLTGSALVWPLSFLIWTLAASLLPLSLRSSVHAVHHSSWTCHPLPHFAFRIMTKPYGPLLTRLSNLISWPLPPPPISVPYTPAKLSLVSFHTIPSSPCELGLGQKVRRKKMVPFLPR